MSGLLSMYKKSMKKWSNPPKSPSKKQSESIYPCKRTESFTSPTSDATFSSEFDGSPSSATIVSELSVSPMSLAFPLRDDSSDITYGCGDATPDANSNKKYGYGEAAPDDKAKLAYGDAAPDDKTVYGYEDNSHRTFSRKTSRRSSMKKSGSPRRASIRFGGEIEVNLPGRNKPVKRRTSISFNESARVKSVTPVSELTDKPEQLWFQDDEYDKMKEKSYDIVDKVECGMAKGKNYCTRGLEKMMKKRANEVLRQKYDGWDCVLNEQDLQRDQDIFDDDYMGNIYKYSALASRREAAERAKHDAVEIQNYQRSTRELCRRLSM
jgi:hypothetical protein